MKRVAVTGASGQVGSFLSFLAAREEIFGPDEPIELRLLVKPENLKKCEGVRMELEDCFLPRLQKVVCTDEAGCAFDGADLVFFAGAAIGLSREVREANWEALAKQGEALGRSARRDAVSIVIANPCNTNAYVLFKSSGLASDRFHALTLLDEHRASNACRRRVPVFGNHSPTVAVEGSREFVRILQTRAPAVTEMKGGISSGFSACWAAVSHARALYRKGSLFSSGVYSGSNRYGIDPDLFYSFPCRSLGEGAFEIEDLPVGGELLERMRISERELQEERESALRSFQKMKTSLNFSGSISPSI